MDCLLNDIENAMSNRCKTNDSNNHMHDINCTLIKKVIKKLNRGKSDGFDGLTSDYIINGSTLLFQYISVLFTFMIKYGHAPDSLCVSTMISIPKNKIGNISDSQNYRGIALSSILGKLLELCIIDLQGDV